VVAGYYTTSTAFLEALAEAGVKYLFAKKKIQRMKEKNA